MRGTISARLISLFVALAGVAASAIWLFWLALHRLVARDEGFYTIAAALTDVKQLYVEFFFPQGPMSAAVYAAGFSLGGVSWDTARCVAALFSVLLVAAMWAYWLRLYGSAITTVALIALCTSNVFFVWMPTAQSYAPAAFFSIVSCLLLYRNSRHVPAWHCGFAGLLLGCAILTRLYLAALFIPGVIVILLYQEQRYRKIAAYTCGTLAFPALFVLYHIDHLDVLRFNLIDYHLLRSTHSFLESLPQKQTVAAVLFGLKSTIKFEVNQLAMLTWLFLLLSLLRLCIRGSISVWSLFVCTMVVVSLLPDPPYVQYFCLVIPFLILAITDDTAAFFLEKRRLARQPLFFMLCIFFLAVYTRGIREDTHRYVRTGQGVIGIYNEQNARIWNLDHIRRVSSLIEEQFPAGPVYSYWPGFLLETTHPPAAGFENHFAPRIADQVPEAFRHRYHIGHLDELQSRIKEGSLAGLVTDSQLDSTARQAGYSRLAGIANPLLYVRSSAP